MREAGRDFGDAKSAHNLAKCGRPPPVAVAAMLGLTGSPGQANAGHRNYDFSLVTPNFPDLSGL